MIGYKGQIWSVNCVQCGQKIEANFPQPSPMCYFCLHTEEKAQAWYEKHHFPIIRARRNLHKGSV